MGTGKPSLRERAICIMAAALLTASLASAKNSQKLAPDLKSDKSGGVVDIIVQFKGEPNERHHKKVLARGGQLKHEMKHVRAGLYSVPAAVLDDVSEDPDVLYISPDRPLSGTLEFATPAINAPIARSYGWDGLGVGIAILDSGISDDEDLKDPVTSSNRVVFKQGFYPGGKVVDVYGHGTPVAGAAAGSGKSSAGKYTGVAPRAKLINLRVLSDDGNGQDSYVIAAIDRAIHLKATHNIRVLNLSLGRPVYESYTRDPLCQAVERAWMAGIVVVVSAGNEGRNDSAGTAGYGTITSPGNHPLVITVGAMRDMGSVSRADDFIASYSSKGPTLLDHVVKPDLVAPGNLIVSPQGKGGHKLAHDYSGNKVTGTYFRLSGTSLAAPMVSGAAALLLQKEPNLTPDQVKARLMKTATKQFPSFSTATDPITGKVYHSHW